mmetsp:Transcript_62889/g.183908  ORF Transcript_62889/g.183908 Transcript_62889/m.183908 type:complete len:336 (+) Transcript_62889:106-1113(+)
MSSTAAHISCVSAVVLSIMWLLCLTCSGSWITSIGVIVNFSATPFKVKSEQGGFTGLMSWTASMVGLKKKAAQVESMFNQELWLDDAMQLYCNPGIEEIFRWCHSWCIVAFSSWAMVFCGVVAALAFAVGAMFMFFYTSVQATETGRKCVKSCFALAPAIATVGVAQYTLGTLDFGQDSAVLSGLGGGASGGLASQTMFGLGFILACVLVVFSWVPLYAMMIVFRPDPLEISDSDCDSSGDEAARKRGAAAGGYGATGYAAAGGYGAYGAPGYPAAGGYGAAAEMLPQNPYQPQGPQYQNFSYAGQQPNYGGAYGGSPPPPYYGGGLGGGPGGRQ